MQVVLSLLLNLLLGGASVIWWSGAASGRSSVVFRSGSQRISSREAPGFTACERAELDPTKLEEWGCKVFNKVCFDQVRCTLAVICRAWR